MADQVPGITKRARPVGLGSSKSQARLEHNHPSHRTSRSSSSFEVEGGVSLLLPSLKTELLASSVCMSSLISCQQSSAASQEFFTSGVRRTHWKHDPYITGFNNKVWKFRVPCCLAGAPCVFAKVHVSNHAKTNATRVSAQQPGHNLHELYYPTFPLTYLPAIGYPLFLQHSWPHCPQTYSACRLRLRIKMAFGHRPGHLILDITIIVNRHGIYQREWNTS